ncbi:hypothetical protein AcW1_007240 [Taiwanofungus camphoratus]|nr:hypothetical protein AcW1_007240 [Antrodia cinnamomea]
MLLGLRAFGIHINLLCPTIDVFIDIAFRFVLVVLIIPQANLAPEPRLTVESMRLGVTYEALVTADSVLTSMQRWCPRTVYRSPDTNQGGKLRT